MSDVSMTNTELADWLGCLDSHTIYSADILSELPDDMAAVVPVQSTKQVRAAIEARGLGGELRAPENARLFTGYMASMAICTARLGHDRANAAYGRLSGRGSIHRAAISALRESDESQS